MFSVFDFVHYCMQNAEENKLKLKLKQTRFENKSNWHYMQIMVTYYYNTCTNEQDV